MAMFKTEKTMDYFAAMEPKVQAKLEIFDPEENKNKFWRAYVYEDTNGDAYVVRHWGRNGSKGQSMVERTYSTYQAKIEFDKLYEQKSRKGYRPEASPLDKIVREV
jgi:predicted DNA-binding WGR domain protein